MTSVSNNHCCGCARNSAFFGTIDVQPQKGAERVSAVSHASHMRSRPNMSQHAEEEEAEGEAEEEAWRKKRMTRTRGEEVEVAEPNVPPIPCQLTATWHVPAVSSFVKKRFQRPLRRRPAEAHEQRPRFGEISLHNKYGIWFAIVQLRNGRQTRAPAF